MNNSNPIDPLRGYESATDEGMTPDEFDALMEQSTEAHMAKDGRGGVPLESTRPLQRYEICPGCGGSSGGWSRNMPPDPYYCDKCEELLQLEAEYREMGGNALEPESFRALWHWLVFGLSFSCVIVLAFEFGLWLQAILKGGE